MKLSCEKAILLNAITTASRTVSLKSTLTILEGLLLTADNDELSITGYNLKTGIRTTVNADVEDNGSLVLNARLFGEIVRKMPDDVVTIHAEPNLMVKITCGQTTFDIIATSAEDFPELPSIDAQNSISIREDILKAMISQTIFAVSDNETKPVHMGSLFDLNNGVLTVVSVDGYRLALRREFLDTTEAIPDISFVVPGSALNEVEKIALDREELVTITLGTRHIMFKLDSTELISRRIEGEFLDYKKSIPTLNKYSFIADRKALINSVERVSMIINDKQKSPVRCTFGDDILLLNTATALGRACDECPVSGNGENLEIGFNNRYMLDTLKAVPSNEIKLLFNTGLTPCIIVPTDDSDNFLYMILPVRLRSDDY